MAEEIKAILADEGKFMEVCQTAFASVDTDGSGAVDAKELMNLMTAMAADCGIPAPSQEDCDNAMKALDTDGDKKVNVQEFSVLIRSILEAICNA